MCTKAHPRPSAVTETAKTEKRLSVVANGALTPTSYQLFAGEFRYSAEQWNFKPEERNFGLAGSRYSIDMARINEKSANR
jgi:hypothetical protein